MSNLLELVLRHRNKILLLALIPMIAASAYRMSFEFHRLLIAEGRLGAIDLELRYDETQTWLDGESVYEHYYSAVYPPASYLMMAPFLGHDSYVFVRWLWGFTIIAALAVLIAVLTRVFQTTSWIERAYVLFLVLGIYATGPTIGNGQLTIHVMAALALAILLSARESRGPMNLVITSAVFVVALIKPTVAAPFFLVYVFAPGKFRYAVCVGALYAVLALVASTFQEGNVIENHRFWMQRGLEGAAFGSQGGGGGVGDFGEASEGEHGEHGEGYSKDEFLPVGVGLGYASLHDWLGARGHSDWDMAGTLVVLVMLAIWIFFHRRADLWVIVGVTAIVSRFWTYHLVYDDMLLLFSVAALYRIAYDEEAWVGIRLASIVMMGVYTVVALVPASMRLMHAPWGDMFKDMQGVTWLAILVVLCVYAWRNRVPAESPSAS